MISTTFGWHLPRSHSEIAPDNTIFISRTTNRFQFSPLESIIKQRRSVTEDPRHFRKARHIPNLEQMTIEVALGRVELKRKRVAEKSGNRSLISYPDLTLFYNRSLGPNFPSRPSSSFFLFDDFGKRVSEASAWDWSCSARKMSIFTFPYSPTPAAKKGKPVWMERSTQRVNIIDWFLLPDL